MNPFAFIGILAALLAATGNTRDKPHAPIPSSAPVAVLVWIMVGISMVYGLTILVEAIYLQDFGLFCLGLGWTLSSLVALFPWPIARMWLIPRGHIRSAWLISRMSLWVWRRDVPGGAMVVACWAALRHSQRRGPLSAKQLAWLERRLDVQPRASVRWKLGGAGIVAAGLLADARGDRERARQLLASAAELAQPTWPAQAIVTAWSWLCADAIERGAWREAEFLARTAPIETRMTTFLGSVAARLTGIAPVPNDLVLQWQWFAAPHRRDTHALLQRALAAPAVAQQRTPPVEDPLDEADPSETPEAEVADTDTLAHAMQLHAQALRRPPEQLGRGELISLAQAWDLALEDAALEEHMVERGDALGAHETEWEPTQLGECVRDDLLALIHDAGLELGPLGETSELLGRAARRLHGELLDNLEIAIGALESRVDQHRELPALGEWQDFLSIREQYARAASLGGLQLRRLAFSIVHGPLCSLAVWLWNDRSERAIGNAMFQWLLAEAIVVDDSKAITLQEKNVDCGV